MGMVGAPVRALAVFLLTGHPPAKAGVASVVAASSTNAVLRRVVLVMIVVLLLGDGVGKPGGRFADTIGIYASS